MWQLRIEDTRPGQKPGSRFLAFDLRHILRALGPSTLDAMWGVSGVQEDNEELFATGDGASELEALALSGEWIVGSRFLEIAERTHQVIWGDFRSFKDRKGSYWIRITAYDSAWYAVVCEDRTIIDRIASAFKQTSVTRLPRTGI